MSRFELTDSSLLADVAALRERFGQRSAALVETIRLRRRAVVKFASLADVSDWLFTDEALQQATTAVVARHRARRLAGAGVHDATCSIGTELAALRDTAEFVVGSDIDEVRLAMARHNVPGVALVRADALRPITGGAINRDTIVLLDPARRGGGRRRFDPRAYAPPLDELFEVYRDRPTVVKCAPGIDFDAVRGLGLSFSSSAASSLR